MADRVGGTLQYWSGASDLSTLWCYWPRSDGLCGLAGLYRAGLCHDSVIYQVVSSKGEVMKAEQPQAGSADGEETAAIVAHGGERGQILMFIRRESQSVFAATFTSLVLWVVSSGRASTDTCPVMERISGAWIQAPEKVLTTSKSMCC